MPRYFVRKSTTTVAISHDHLRGHSGHLQKGPWSSTLYLSSECKNDNKDTIMLNPLLKERIFCIEEQVQL